MDVAFGRSLRSTIRRFVGDHSEDIHVVSVGAGGSSKFDLPSATLRQARCLGQCRHQGDGGRAVGIALSPNQRSGATRERRTPRTWKFLKTQSQKSHISRDKPSDILPSLVEVPVVRRLTGRITVTRRCTCGVSMSYLWCVVVSSLIDVPCGLTQENKSIGCYTSVMHFTVTIGQRELSQGSKTLDSGTLARSRHSQAFGFPLFQGSNNWHRRKDGRALRARAD